MIIRSWGANSHGQLGLGTKCEQVEELIKLEHCPDSVKQIACGGGHTLALDDKGNLYSCGWNSRLQLGTEEQTEHLKRVWPLSGICFTNIACGWDFSCGVTDDNFLIVWGSNSNGQLGLPKDHFSETIKPMKLQVNARLVSMGLRHTVIVNSKGGVWVTGSGRHGQLGLGTEILNSDRFLEISNIGKISHIACGQNHTVGWCSEEKALYVWGDNKHGQLLLCTEKYKKIYKPQKIDIDVKQEVKKLLSGWTNVLLWLENGKVFTWGRNNYGQLGTNKVFEGKILQITLPGNREMQDISLGSEHTICLATDNTLWAWGWNEHSNTGTKSGDSVFHPTMVPIEIKGNYKMLQVYAGGAHNFAVMEEDQEIIPSDEDLQTA